MLDLRRCREILGSDCPLSDDQIELLRDQLVALADVALDTKLQDLRNGATSVLDMAVSVVPEEQRREIGERASIMEFDGGLPRDQAERAALRIWARMQSDSGRIN